MVYKQLGLMITDQCTASCRFCAVRCNPSNHQVMSFDFAKKILDQAFSEGIDQRVGISGGEAFLYPELVKQILEYAKEKGYPERTVASNGFWGAWSDEKLDEVLGGLKDSLTCVSFSHDMFHAEYVKTELLWRAVKALDKWNIPYNINIADVYGDMSAIEFFASAGDDSFFRNYALYPLAAMGNAENLPEEIFVRTKSREEVVCYPRNTLGIGVNGNVYPCCCPGILSTNFCLGNLNDTPLSEILKKSQGIKYLRTMCDPVRFRKLLSYAEEELNIKLPQKAVDGCELCYMIFSKPGAFEALQPFFEKEYFSLVTERLFEKGETE